MQALPQPIYLSLQDGEWPMTYIDHDRAAARGIVYDEEGYFYFAGEQRDDMFGRCAYVETAGGGVEAGESVDDAIVRELQEELGATVEVVCKLAVVDDYYNLIHRHNVSHYYLCKALSFGEKHLTPEEQAHFHLTTRKLTYDEALAAYETCSESKFGRLLARREVPVLRHAKAVLEALARQS